MRKRTKTYLERTLTTVSDAAASLKTDRNHVQWLIRSGKLDAVQIGNYYLVLKTDVELLRALPSNA